MSPHHPATQQQQQERGAPRAGEPLILSSLVFLSTFYIICSCCIIIIVAKKKSNFTKQHQQRQQIFFLKEEKERRYFTGTGTVLCLLCAYCCTVPVRPHCTQPASSSSNKQSTVRRTYVRTVRITESVRVQQQPYPSTEKAIILAFAYIRHFL